MGTRIGKVLAARGGFFPKSNGPCVLYVDLANLTDFSKSIKQILGARESFGGRLFVKTC